MPRPARAGPRARCGRRRRCRRPRQHGAEAVVEVAAQSSALLLRGHHHPLAGVLQLLGEPRASAGPGRAAPHELEDGGVARGSSVWCSGIPTTRSPTCSAPAYSPTAVVGPATVPGHRERAASSWQELRRRQVGGGAHGVQPALRVAAAAAARRRDSATTPTGSGRPPKSTWSSASRTRRSTGWKPAATTTQSSERRASRGGGAPAHGLEPPRACR